MERLRVEIVIEASTSGEAQSLMHAWKAVLESLRSSTSTISVQAPVH
jgi:hypothetical protein